MNASGRRVDGHPSGAVGLSEFHGRVTTLVSSATAAMRARARPSRVAPVPTGNALLRRDGPRWETNVSLRVGLDAHEARK